MVLSKLAALGVLILAAASSCEGPGADDTEESTLAPAPSEQVEVLANAPDEGELSTAGVMLRWRKEGTQLTYRLMYEAPSACYSAGASSHVVTSDKAVLIRADIAFKDATCAQMITVVKFEGTVEGVPSPFGIAAVITDSKTGTRIPLPAPQQ